MSRSRPEVFSSISGIAPAAASVAFGDGCPDQASIAGGLRAGEYDGLEAHLCQWAGAIDGLHHRFGNGSGS